jgi:hypothetical protein
MALLGSPGLASGLPVMASEDIRTIRSYGEMQKIAMPDRYDEVLSN